MTAQPQTQVQIFRETATPEDFRNANIGDWIQGVGEIQTEFEKRFIRNYGSMIGSHSSATTGAEQVLESLRHIEEAHEILFNSMIGVDEVEVRKLRRVSDLLLAAKLKLRQERER